MQNQIDDDQFLTYATLSEKPLYRRLFCKQLLVKAIDVAPLVEGASLRLPHQPKVDHTEKSVILTTRSFRPDPSQKTSVWEDIEACLPFYAPSSYDVARGISIPLPIIAVQPAEVNQQFGELDELNVRQAYIASTRLSGAEVNFVAHNTNCKKVESSAPPYCVVCEKQHDGANRF